MLRQANDHLERTMNEKQELVDSMKQGNEETAAKVCHRFGGFSRELTVLCHRDDVVAHS